MVSLETKKYNSRKQEKCQHYQPVKLIKINMLHMKKSWILILVEWYKKLNLLILL